MTTEQPPVPEKKELPKSLDIDLTVPIEVRDYPGLFALGQMQVLGTQEANEAMIDSAEQEYDSMVRAVQLRVDNISAVEKGTNGAGDPEMIVPGTLESTIATIMMHCVVKNIAEARSYLNDLAINGNGPEDIAAYNHLAPLVDALELIDKSKETE